MKHTTQNTVHLGVRVPKDLWDALDSLSKENDRPVSGEVRLALRQWTSPEAVRDRNGGK